MCFIKRRFVTLKKVEKHSIIELTEIEIKA